MVSWPILRLAVVIASTAIVASCSSPGARIGYLTHSKEYFSERDYGAASPRVVAGESVPKGGGHAVVGDPYRVAGRTYVPKENPRYSKVGLASWYGDAFHGRLTANGEVYDVNGLTAAHPTMPLPSYARVTNLDNGRSIVVRVNDRGPFAADRIIDVSERVAGMLGFENAGTASVKVDYVGPAQMDGQDENKLLASYRAPDTGGTMFASNAAPVSRAPVVLASAVTRLQRAVPAVYQPPQAAAFDPLVITPTYSPSTDGYDDPLAPLIMRSGFVSSYASPATLTPAQQAADVLAEPDALQAALNRAVAKKASQMGMAGQTLRDATVGTPVAVVQIGSFSDSGNAGRVARNFGRFGRVETTQEQVGSRALTVVRVAVDPAVPLSTVVATASQIGLNGAFVLNR